MTKIFFKDTVCDDTGHKLYRVIRLSVVTEIVPASHYFHKKYPGVRSSIQSVSLGSNAYRCNLQFGYPLSISTMEKNHKNLN